MNNVTIMFSKMSMKEKQNKVLKLNIHRPIICNKIWMKIKELILIHKTVEGYLFTRLYLEKQTKINKWINKQINK